MIRLNCFIKVSDEKKGLVLEAAKRLTEASVLQEGCKGYDIFESATRPDVMMICETWADDKALDAHSNSEVFVKEVAIMRENSEMYLERFEF